MALCGPDTWPQLNKTLTLGGNRDDLGQDPDTMATIEMAGKNPGMSGFPLEAQSRRQGVNLHSAADTHNHRRNRFERRPLSPLPSPQSLAIFYFLSNQDFFQILIG